MNNSITSINVFNVLKSFSEKFQFLSYRDRKKIVGISNELLKVEIKEDPIKLMSDILSVDEDEIGYMVEHELSDNNSKRTIADLVETALLNNIDLGIDIQESGDEVYQKIERLINLFSTLDKLGILDDNIIVEYKKWFSSLTDDFIATKEDVDYINDTISHVISIIENKILSFNNCSDDNFYLTKKKCLNMTGLKEDKYKNLIVPLYHVITNEFLGYETITKFGKFNSSGTMMKSAVFAFKKPGISINDVDQIYIAEGVATASSIYEALNKFDNSKNYIVYSCISAYNVIHVVNSISSHYEKQIIVCRDADVFNQMTTGDTGLNVATSASRKYGVTYITPYFKNQILEAVKNKSDKEASKIKGKRLKGYTDFNDLHISEGIDAVIDVIKTIKTVDYSDLSRDNSKYIDIKKISSKVKFIFELYDSDEYLDAISTHNELVQNHKVKNAKAIYESFLVGKKSKVKPKTIKCDFIENRTDYIYDKFKDVLDKRNINKAFFTYIDTGRVPDGITFTTKKTLQNIINDNLIKDERLSFIKNNYADILVHIAYCHVINTINVTGSFSAAEQILLKYKFHIKTHRNIMLTLAHINSINANVMPHTHTPLKNKNYLVNLQYINETDNKSKRITYDYYLDIKDIKEFNRGTNFVEAPMGSGKTDTIMRKIVEQNTLDKKKTVIIVPSIHLKNSIINRIGKDLIIDIDDVRRKTAAKMSAYMEQDENKNKYTLICVLPSLSIDAVQTFINRSENDSIGSAGIGIKDITVICDEITTLSNMFMSKDIMQNRLDNALVIFGFFMKLIKRCKKSILMDANINDSSLSLIETFKLQNTYVHNVVKLASNRKVYTVDHNLFLDMIEKNNKNGLKNVIVCDTKDNVEKLNHRFRKYNNLLITSDHIMDYYVNEFLKNPIEEIKKYDNVIYSPQFGAGNHIASYGINDVVDGVFGFFTGSSICPRTAAQLIGRTRSNRCDIYIHFKPGFKTKTGVISEEGKSKLNQTRDLIIKTKDYEDINAYTRHLEIIMDLDDHWRHNYLQTLLQCLNHSGLIFSGYKESEKKDHDTNDHNENVLRTIGSIKCELYTNAPQHKLNSDKITSVVNALNNNETVTKSEIDVLKANMITKIYDIKSNEHGKLDFNYETIKTFEDNNTMIRYLTTQRVYNELPLYDLCHRKNITYRQTMYTKIFGAGFNNIAEAPEGLYLTKAGMSNIVNKILNNGVFIEFLNEEKIISRHVASELKKGRLTETSVISMLKLLGFVIENKRDGNKVVKMNEDYDKTIKLYKRLGLNRLL